MLLEREDLRDRLLGVVGHGHLARTTKALDEAGSRVSRQLLLQTVVNLIYGAIAAAGLWLFGVPYPLFWGACGAVLRFIPYLGPLSAAAGPIVIAFAALPGWTRPLEVAAFYAALEIFTNMVLETILYAGAMGVSQVSLMVSVAFWTWLWGPLGLLMATPLTVCLVVLGKHVPGLHFLGTLLSDAPALTPESNYYQRLLARDQAEAVDIVERFVKTDSTNAVFDSMLIPALNFAERDRIEGLLSTAEEAAVIETTRDVLDVLAERSGGGRSRHRDGARAGLRRQRHRRRAGAQDARTVHRRPSRGAGSRDHSGPRVGVDRIRSSEQVLDRLHRGSPAEPVDEDPVPGEEAPRGAARGAHHGRPLGARDAWPTMGRSRCWMRAPHTWRRRLADTRSTSRKPPT